MDVRLRAFPSRDREFVAFAQAAVAVLPEPATPATLQQALRVRYPAAVVTQQAELARHGSGPVVWYAYRTAAAWGEFKANGSLASTLRFNYADGRPRELAYDLVANADGPGRHRLTVRVIEGG
ncbi:MAG: hypothetical protein HYX55_05485 [Chloroflexi bacterium]|nr:hypothetical protein [Chloroflexota bacterium]